MGEPEVRLLGPVVVEVGSERPTRSTMLRTLLALLGCASGRAVSSDVLVDELWGEDLPQDPRAALAVQVTRLRAWLAVDAPRAGPVRSERGGYRLAVAPERIDVVRFDSAAQAVDAATDPEASLAHTEAALAEWRDTPFGGCVVGPRLHADQVRLAERRLQLVERRAELLLARDEPARALDGLLPVRAGELGRERLTLLVMLAHRRLDRRQDGLAAYREYAEHLRDEYGLSPGRAVRQVHADLLAEDPPPVRPRPGRPPLVGRVDALREIREAAARGGLVVVAGPAGIGKSVLLRAVLDEAADGGARVGAGGWDHDDAPLSAWREALGGLGVPSREPVSGDGAHRRLCGLAERGRVVVGLDDAHRADPASLGVLRGIVRRGLPAGALVVVTVREPDEAASAAPWAEAYADLARVEGVRTITLPDLARGDVVTLAATRLAHLGAGTARRIGEAVATRSAGHPLYASALLDLLVDERDEEACRTQVAVVPDAVRPLLARQIALLPASCRGPLEALASLRPVALDTLASVLGSTPLRVLEDVRAGLDAGLLIEVDPGAPSPPTGPAVHVPADGVDFRHDLVADVVADAVPGTQRRRLHRAALTALDAGADPFERRRHGLGAGPLVGAGELAELNRLAGHAAHRRGAPRQALQLLDAAAAHGAPEHRADVALGRGLALTALGRLPEAHEVLDAIVEDLDPTEEQALRAAIGDGTLGAQVTGDVRRLARLRRVAARPGSATLPARDRMELLLALTVEETVLEGRVTFPGAVADLAGLATQLADAPDPDVATRARMVLLRGLAEAPVPVGQRLAAVRAAVERADAAREHANRLDAGEALVAALLAHARIEEARDVCWSVRQEARRVRRPRSVWVASLVDAALALAAGDVDEADALAARAHGLGREAGLPDAAGSLQAFTMVRHWQTGTAALLGEVPAAAARAYPHIPAWTAAAACADLQAGRVEAAAEHLRRFRERRAVLEARTFDRPALGLAAAAAFRLGDTETAELVRAALPPDPGAVIVLGVGAAIVGPAMFFRGLAEAVLDERDAALEHFEQAAALAGEVGWTPWKETAAAVARRVETGHGPALPLGLGAAG